MRKDARTLSSVPAVDVVAENVKQLAVAANDASPTRGHVQPSCIGEFEIARTRCCAAASARRGLVVLQGGMLLRAPSRTHQTGQEARSILATGVWLVISPLREQGVTMRVRIAIAVESDQRRWIAYGASDTPEGEVMSTVRDIVGGHPVTMWLEVQLPEPPATVPARIEIHNSKYAC
jgi:hypothetical protein